MRPAYEGLDKGGLPCMREARVIGELPTSVERMVACAEARDAIAAIIGQAPRKRLSFGQRVFEAFMSQPEAKKHQHSDLLMTLGCDVSLNLCPSYN